MGGASWTLLTSSGSSPSGAFAPPSAPSPPGPLWLNEPNERRLARLFLLRRFGRGLEPCAPPPRPIEKTDPPLTLALRPLAAVLPIELTEACPRGARRPSSSSVPTTLLLKDARGGTSATSGRCGGSARSISSSSSSWRSTLGGSLRGVTRPLAVDDAAPGRLRKALAPPLLVADAVRVCGTDSAALAGAGGRVSAGGGPPGSVRVGE